MRGILAMDLRFMAESDIARLQIYMIGLIVEDPDGNTIMLSGDSESNKSSN